MNIRSEALDINNELIKWRRDLHKMPEIGMILPDTCEYVKNRLDEMGIEYITYDNHSGICAVLGKKDAYNQTK